MKKVQILLYSILFTGSISAQQLSPEAAFERALAQNPALLQEKVNLELAQLKVRQSRQAWIGRIDGSLDTRYNLARQTLVLPAEAFGGTPGQFRNIQQGTPWVMTPALDLTQPLYKPVLQGDMLTAGAELTRAETAFAEKTLNTRYDVYMAYLKLALSEEKLKQMQAGLEKYTTEKERLQSRYNEGRALRTELDKALLNERLAVSDLNKARTEQERASADLSRILGDSVLLSTYSTGGLEMFYENEMKNVPAGNADLSQSFAVIRARNSYEENTVQQRTNRLKYAPDINFYGRLATQAFREQFDFYKTSQQWYGYSYLGLEIKMPIFDGLDKKRNQTRLRLEQQKLALARTQELQQASYDYSDAGWQYRTAAEDVANRRTDLELAGRILEETRRLQAQGRATETELRDSEKTLNDTRMNLMNALSDQLKALFLQRKVAGKW
ncbi:MAG: TolC family protein [Flavobacteriales bacterium]